jgi:hypothetical protein
VTGSGAVVVQIGGGLGNQLFQYAMGRRLALVNGMPLILDHLSTFPRDFHRRKFVLDRFNIQCGYVPPSASYASLPGRFRRRWDRWVNHMRDPARRSYIAENPAQAFEPALLDFKVNHPIYFEGYWQHEEYFRDMAPQIRADFTPKNPFDEVNLEWARRIGAVNAVCLHVRRLRGVPNMPDAQPLPESEKLHVGMDYYKRALAFLLARVRDPHIFVFSDYPEWARENIRGAFPVEFVTHNGPSQDYADLWLMSLCRHFVNANSTFSWWAAWLSTYAEKIVLAPHSGLGTGFHSVPPSWHLL